MAGSGLTYGYGAVSRKSDEWTVVEAEAQSVWRIFGKYLDGRTSAEFAHNTQRYGPFGSGPRLPHQSMAPARRRTFFSERSLCRSPCREQSQDLEGYRLGKSLSRVERATGRLLTCQRLQLSGQSYFRLQRTFKEERSCSLAVISAGFVECSLPCFVAVQAWQWMEDTNPATFAARRAVSAACPPDAPGSEAHPRQ